jgi:hypothetical protein
VPEAQPSLRPSGRWCTRNGAPSSSAGGRGDEEPAAQLWRQAEVKSATSGSGRSARNAHRRLQGWAHAEGDEDQCEAKLTLGGGLDDPCTVTALG